MSKDQDVLEGINDFINHMAEFTPQLVQIVDGKIIKCGTGMLLCRGERLFFLTAMHVVVGDGWFLETSWSTAGKATVCLPVRQANLQLTSIDEDLAWYEIDAKSLFSQVKGDPEIDPAKATFAVYKGPLNTVLDSSLPYGFACYKSMEVVSNNPFRLYREVHCEIGMSYKGKHGNTDYLIFVPANGHKGHGYYHGCSGSPIADDEGRIVALVKGPDNAEHPEAILGIPLAKYTDLFK